MKKLFLAVIFTTVTLFAYSQKTDSLLRKDKGNNELKLNLAYTIGGFPEINYERIIKDDMSVGLGILIGLEDNVEFKFAFIPNYRIYFGRKKANGFFIEGNAAVVTTRGDEYYFDDLGLRSKKEPTETNFGLGAAAGGKFLTRNGFVGEAYLGIGRLFGSNVTGGYPRAGITIGKRF